MSHSVRERLRVLQDDVRDMRVMPAADVRARGRSRGRRRTAALTAAGAVVAATAGVAFLVPHERSAPSSPVAGRPAIPCVLTLPDSPADVRIRVFGGGAPAGSVDAVVAGLRDRQFPVESIATGGERASTTVVRYGPAAIGAAAVVRAVVHGATGTRFDPGRADATVDLILGTAFTRLATPIEINQNLATAGEPTAPAGC